MDDNNQMTKQEMIDKYYGKWDFINPRWILFLGVVFGLVQLGLYTLIGASGVRITDSIFVTRAVAAFREITALDIVYAVVHVILVVAILYVSVRVLPSDKRHNRLRLAGIFVIVGSLFKVMMSFVGHDMALVIEVGKSFKLPMPTCADLYMLGGFIAMIVIVAKRYSNQDMEEIMRCWKTSRTQKRNK